MGTVRAQRQDAVAALHPSNARDRGPLPDRLRAQRGFRRRTNGRLPLHTEGSRRRRAGRSHDRQDHPPRWSWHIHAREDREARGARMHAEHYSVPPEAARIVEGARRVVAEGTTVARTLETRDVTGEAEGESELFVYPGY